MACVATVLLINWYQPGVAADGKPLAAINTKYIENSLALKPQSNFDTEVLVPLRAKQAEAAKAEEARLAAQRQAELDRAREVQPSQAPVTQTSGGCGSWMAQAGITDQANAMILINKESGCNPNAVNSSSGACGIGQQLPCGKWPHAWNDPVGSLIDMQAYVYGRYGSWANAVQWHYAHNWY